MQKWVGAKKYGKYSQENNPKIEARCLLQARWEHGARKSVYGRGGEALVLAAAEGDSEQNADCDDLMDARGVCALWPKAHDTVSLLCVCGLCA